jgi:hypothetical protein
MHDITRAAGIRGLVEATSGVVSLDECRQAGLADEQVWWLVESGRWQSPFPRVFVAFSGPIPRTTLIEAALSYAGPESVVCGPTAAALWGLCGWPEDIHLVVPYPHDVTEQPGIQVHRSRTLGVLDVHPALRPRRLRIEATVRDLLRTRRSVDAALGVVADAVRSKRTTATLLRTALLEHPKTRWRGEVLRALPDIDAGAHSRLELEDARIRRRHGLPAGTRQFRRRRDGTEFLDVLVEEFGVHTELDGRLGHDRALESWRDMRRDNASVVQRLRHLRYGWADLFGRPCEVAIEQGLVLRQQGWSGRFRRCRTCPPTLPPGL